MAGSDSLPNGAFDKLIVDRLNKGMNTATTQSSSTRKALKALDLIDYNEHVTTIKRDGKLSDRILALFFVTE